MNKTTILIIEDEAIVAADLSGKLAMLGYEVVGSVSTGEEAIKSACRLYPQLILMDIRLKGAMDGIEAAEEIRRLLDTPVIYLTAHSDANTLERAKLTGPFGYVLKPFDERDLAATIELALYKHQNERQMREQRELLRVTLASIGDAVITCDTGGRITYMNPVAEDVSGWTTRAAAGVTISRVLCLLDEKAHRSIDDILALVFREGKTQTLSDHKVLITTDFRHVPIENSAAPILGADGRVVGAVFVFRDVTEKRRNQEALQAQSESLQLANEELASANEGLRVQGEELAVYCQDLENAKTALRESHIELENRVADRTRELVRTIGKLEAENKARQEAEKELRTSEETVRRLNRLYAVVSATNHAIVHADTSEAIFQEFCRVAVELGGFRLAWVGLVDRESGLVNLVAASGITEYIDGIRITVNMEPEGLGPTGRAVRDGGHYICNDFHASDITRPWHERAHAHGLYASAGIAIKQGGKVIGALTLYAGEKYFFDSQHEELLRQMGEDVSFALDNIRQARLRREAEEALLLETEARLRTAEELREKERMLIMQSRQAAMGEMIGNVAHQWRQPLNTLALLVQQTQLFQQLGELNEENLNAHTTKSMELIQHMSRTIEDFRSFFKPDKEKIKFSAKQEISKTLSLLEGSIHSQNIRIEVEARDDAVINGYPNEFCQVLLNILANARDAFKEREIDDPVILISINRGDNLAVITIADNAGGIPEEIIDRVFDPYFTTKGEDSGTGVGLFMSKTIIEKNMGGLLSVRNNGGGAEFRIEV